MFSEWPPLGKEQLLLLITCSLCRTSICCYSFQVWFRGQTFGSVCASTCLLLTFHCYLLLQFQTRFSLNL